MIVTFDGAGPASSDGPVRRARRRWPRWAIGGLVVTVLGAAILAVARLDGAAGIPARNSPSGIAAPVGDLNGWRQIYVEDFDGADLDESWGRYQGQPAGDSYSWWEPSHVQVGGSLLNLAAYQEQGRWVAGGVSNHGVAQTYGKWLVRFRVDASDEMTIHFLLWPKGGDWPPEIDFLENAGGDRTEGSGSLIYRTDAGGRDREHRSVTSDFTSWHTVGVEWLPGSVTYTLDGRDWGSVTGDVVPDVPMWMALQAQVGGCQRKADYGDYRCPIAGTPDQANVQIDWVAVYAPDANASRPNESGAG